MIRLSISVACQSAGLQRALYGRADNRLETGIKSTEKGKATAEHPEFDPKQVVRGIVRRGLKSVAAKEVISLRIDQDVIEWFKAQGPGYQTRMNPVLRAFRDASAS